MASLDSQALNLVDFAKLSNDPRIEAVAYSLARHGAIMQDIPWMRKQSLKLNGARFETLPQSNWVKLNESIATVDGAPVQYSESAFIMRDLIKVDSLMRNDENAIGDPLIQRVDAYLKGRSYVFNEMFIANDQSDATNGDPDAVQGLRGRLDHPDTYKVRSDNKISSGGTMTAGATVANLIGHLEKLDDLLYALEAPEGDDCVIYADKAYIKRLNALLRIHSGVGGFSRAEDQYDRRVFHYKNAIIRDCGVKIDQETPIIAATEAADGSDDSSTYTSVYGVNYGPGEFAGWMASMGVKDVAPEQGFLETMLIEMACGLYPQTKTCIARLHGINLG